MVVLLGYDSEHLQQGYNAVCRLLQRAGVSYEAVNARGDNPLGQMMSLVLYGDYVSYYLALLYHTDPTPVAAIDFLKQESSKKDSPAPQD
jgi:glucose/mannose-6-phosphate isomerase